MSLKYGTQLTALMEPTEDHMSLLKEVLCLVFGHSLVTIEGQVFSRALIEE